MPTFDGTEANDVITPSEASPGVVADPAGTLPGDGDDILNGRGGDDRLEGAGGDDSIDGGDGNDNLDGGRGNDYLAGGDGEDALYGRDGNDTLEIFWNGDTSVDFLAGGPGDDTYIIHSVYVSIYESVLDEGVDTVIADVSWTLGANIQNLTLTFNFDDGPIYYPAGGTGNEIDNRIIGNDGPNNLYGMAGADTILGGGGSDQINGGTGADSMQGGTGADFYYVDNVGDRITEVVGEAIDTVYSTVTFTLGANVEKLYLIGSANVNATGNAQANLIAGNSFANILHGLGGADTFQSGNGPDIVIGGTGNDVFQYLTVVGSTPGARDTLQAGDGAVAFERPGGGQLGDQIDVSAIDASTASGVQHFVFGTSHAVGRLWAEDSVNNLTLIRGNTGGSTAPEFEIAIQDGNVHALAYTAADFLV